MTYTFQTNGFGFHDVERRVVSVGCPRFRFQALFGMDDPGYGIRISKISLCVSRIIHVSVATPPAATCKSWFGSNSVFHREGPNKQGGSHERDIFFGGVLVVYFSYRLRNRPGRGSD